MIDTQFKPAVRYRCTGAGSFDVEKWEELSSYDQFEAASKAPLDAYAFNIYEYPVSTEETQDEVYGESRNISATYFLAGKVMTRAEVKDLTDLPANIEIFKAIYEKMETLGVNRVLLTRTGTWQPLEDTDIVLTSW